MTTKEPYRDGSHKSHCSCSYLLNAVYDERDKVRAAVILNDALCAEKDAENERLRAALEEIADVAHPPDMRAVNIARRTLGRGRGSDG